MTERAAEETQRWLPEIPQDRPLRIVFMGTPGFAVPTLEALIEGPHEVVSVFTQPDRRQGRGKKLKPPPIKEVALAAGIPLRQPEKLATKEYYQQFLADAPDLAVVVAYGKILRPRFLCVPPLGCINCHASLLPYYRGAAPIYWAIANGEKETGMTTMWMDAGMDTGPELMKRAIPIGPNESVASVHDRLAALGAEMLVETLNGLFDGTTMVTQQEHELATHAPMIGKNDNWIDFNRPADVVHNHIRAMDPFPGARVLLNGDKNATMKLFSSRHRPEVSGAPGTFQGIDEEGGLLIACASGAVGLQEVQLAGRKRMPTKQFMAGRQLSEDTTFSIPDLA